MRVPNITTYSNSTYQLGNHTSNLKNANEVVSTQKRINSFSDDPVGLSQVLNLNTTLGNLEQISKNVEVGITWLDGVENALDSVNTLILDVKSQVSRLASASASADERRDAVESINGMIEQIVTLGNTQIHGNYVFAGTDTTAPPFVYNRGEDPPNVSYEGNNDPFKIKTDNNVTVEVGRDGSKTFWDDVVEINSTNNTIVFKEDNGHGSASEKMITATIPEGEYSAKALESLVGNTLNEASATSGYGVTYAVAYDENENHFSIREDGSYEGYLRTQFLWKSGGDAHVNAITASSQIDPDDINFSVLNQDALTIGTPEPPGSEPFRLTWDGKDSWHVENNPGYLMPSKIPGTADGVDLDLNEDGLTDISLGFDLPVLEGESVEFEIVPAKGDHSIGHEIGFHTDNTTYAPPVSDYKPEAINRLTIFAGSNDTIDFIETDSAGVATTLNAVIAPGAYADMDALALEIESTLEAESLANGNGINYAVSYDPENSRFNIREDGTDLNQLDLLWKTGINHAASAGDTLGFYAQDDSITYPSSDITPIQASITIDDTNNYLDFEEVDLGTVTSQELRAVIPSGTYTVIADLETAVETAMNTVSTASGNGATYDVSYDDTTHRFTIEETGFPVLSEFHLLWNTGTDAAESIGSTLGFDTTTDDNGVTTSHVGDDDAVLMEITSEDNVINFRETRIDGTLSDEMRIEIPIGSYTDLGDVATAIQTALRDRSPNEVDYGVSYDYTAGRFMVKGSDSNIKGFELLWKTGQDTDSSAAGLLGFDIVQDDSVTFSESDEALINLIIDGTNNKLDFSEVTGTGSGTTVASLTASVKQKTYTSYGELGKEVEKAMEAESLANGNRIDYSVYWDDQTQRFTIKEKGTELKAFQLLWETGDNAPVSKGGSGQGIGTILGFEPMDDVETSVESSRGVSWGIFDTLIDLNQYLADDDTDGISRILGKLETHFDHMTARIADTGIRYNRLEVRQELTSEIKLSLTDRRSSIEDADFVESVMNLKTIETAYQASLSSTAKLMNISLVDYL